MTMIHNEAVLCGQDDSTPVIRFPIQYRQARMLSFRTFAILYGALSIHLQTDLSLRIHFLNLHSTQRLTVHLPEHHLTVVCGTDYRELLRATNTRKTLFAQICEKLYLEYTSRGYELLFPGLKPRGAPRRHPQEASIVQYRTEQLEDEHQRLRLTMSQCIEQTVIIARRWLEQYAARAQRQRRERRDRAAKQIQARARGLAAKRRYQQARAAHRQATRMQELAATLIQQQFRRRSEAERRRRQRLREQRDATGTRFRLATSVNGTFVLVLVVLDEIDAGANAIDCHVHVLHPTASTPGARLRVTHAELLGLLGKSSLQAWGRRRIVEALVREHLDVFRSARHQVLALATRSKLSA